MRNGKLGYPLKLGHIVFQKLNFHSRCCKLIQITSLEGMVSVTIEVIYLKIYSRDLTVRPEPVEG